MDEYGFSLGEAWNCYMWILKARRLGLKIKRESMVQAYIKYGRKN